MGKWSAGVLTIEAGNGQTTSVGTTVPVTPRIRLTDGNGNAIPGVTFNWQITGGGGRVSNSTFTQGLTNATGFSDVPPGGWRLDNGANQLTVWLSLTNGHGPSITFNATGAFPSVPTMHLDAQDASSFTLNGATGVATWRDRAGSARTVGQSTAGMQPTLSASGINSRPAVMFDGANDLLAGNAVAYGITGSRSVFIVFRSTGTVTSGACDGTDGAYLLDRDPTANGVPLTSIKAVGGRWVLQTRIDANLLSGCAPSISAGVSIVNNATTIFSAVQGPLTIGVWGNGTSVGTAFMVGTNTMQPIILGRVGGVPGAPTLAGAIGEVLVFPSALSTTDRQIVERYLGWKWGVTVP
jgi:hypothetical protein